MFRWLILFQEILKKRDAGCVIAHKDCSVNSLFPPCLETRCIFLTGNGRALQTSFSSGFVVPRIKCPFCLWVGPPCSFPATTLPPRPARKPFLARWGHAAPRGTQCRFPTQRMGGLWASERGEGGTGELLPLSLCQNCSWLPGALSDTVG